jgi:hypothetical protein
MKCKCIYSTINASAHGSYSYGLFVWRLRSGQAQGIQDKTAAVSFASLEAEATKSHNKLLSALLHTPDQASASE